MQAIIHQHPIIFFQDGRHHIDAAIQRFIDKPNRLKEIHLLTDQRDPALGKSILAQRRQLLHGDGGSHAHANATGRLRVMTNHRRFGNDGFSDGFHRHIANHRCGLVDANFCYVLQRPRRVIQRLLQGRDYPGDIIPRAFHTGRGDNPAADKPAILRQRHFGGGVADIDPCN